MLEIKGNNTEAIVYTDNIDNSAYQQIKEICDHPSFNNSSVRIMPDCHAGTGCVIGFTAVLAEKSVIPNIVGVDIGCGVMTSVFTTDKPVDYKALDEFIRYNIPSGMNVRDTPYELIDNSVIDDVDLICRNIKGDALRDTFINSIGTLGGGNHFIEIDRISDNTFMLSVHTGSRNLGVRVCNYYQSLGKTVDEKLRRSIIQKHKTAKTQEEHKAIENEVNNLPEVSPELAYISDDIYDKYVECMLSAMRYAKANRTVISDLIMNYLSDNENVTQTERFDTIHNYIDWYDEEHSSIIIRKGAISAKSGQRLCIPLNMRDGVVIGTGKGNEEWNCSAPHGSGRIMSRSQAKNDIAMKDYIESMKNIHSWSVNESTIDESPMAYKASDEIIRYLADTVDIECVAKTIYNFKAN
ncbi:MAG: RtcB family protein [Treponema sp.]|uniref:RtcB family protein n=1 Tax=Treponema sp. TaxID=166 RepID=UPI00298E7CEB|nr:RtcB family protein [Treponema sp.]MCQ2602178.1 RtcB family protein [Treponema sp.]